MGDLITRWFGSARPFIPALFTCVSALVLLTLASCNVTKYIPPGKYLYDGSTVKVLNSDSTRNKQLEAEAISVLNNNTNSKIPLIGYRALWRWYRFEEKAAENPQEFADKEHWGEEPIYYDENVVERVNTLLENRAANEGYFNNESDWTQDTSRNPPTISADYTLIVGDPYELDSIRLYWKDSSIARRIDELHPETLLRPGERYQLDNIKDERKRWEDQLREEGYYFIQADDFIFLADTVAGYHEVDMLGKLKNDLPARTLKPQRIAQINVYTNTPSKDSTRRYNAEDRTAVGGLNVICQDCPLRPKIVDEAFVMEAGDLYSPTAHQTTLKRLASYNTFRYIAMDYQLLPGSDSLLRLNAYMEPRLRRRFEGEVGLSYNSADYFGPNLRLAYVNRNLLRGAEVLRIEGDFTMAQFLGQQGAARVSNSLVFGVTGRLEVPRLWLPKRHKLIPRVITSGTILELGTKVESIEMNLAQFTEEITRHSLAALKEELENDEGATERLSLAQFRAQFGYVWRRRVTTNHILNPLSVRLQNPIVSNEEVLDLARFSNLAPEVEGSDGNGRFERMLVISPNYTLNYDSRLKKLTTHAIALTQFVSMNMNNVFPVGKNADLRDTETSYYPLINTDFRYYLTFNSTSQIAARVRGGIAFPLFSDRAIVPYFDLFSVGGPNSLRGFIPRGVGPGTTIPEQNNLLSFGGFGNVVIETSLEYRHRVTPLIELAAFIDAGNVWTYKTELEALETDFKTTAFAGQLAADAGLGVRFDLDFLLLRIDLAYPFQTPYSDEQLDELRPPNIDARSIPDDNLRLVIGFGYPF